jgi:2,3-bisphosphoglycerate-independent phosphoglycerate mutase
LYQDIVKIQQAIDDRTLHQHPMIREACDYAVSQSKTIHIMGLCSDGGVHSHIDHIKALVDACADQGAKNVVLHLFGDGRDTKPQIIREYIQSLTDYCTERGVGRIGSIIGRYYAMDRDNRRERVAKAYHLLVNGQGEQIKSDQDLAVWIQSQYDADITDEFLPAVMLPGYQAIQSGDVVIFANFRTDRAREITTALTQQAFPEYDMQPLNLKYLTMTNYDETYQNVQVLYDKDNVSQVLGEIIEQHGKTQLRIAETEKYPHVTFFFSGGREAPYIGESRILIPSPRVPTYDLEPAMSTQAIADALVEHMQTVGSDFVCCNFAAPDMVGHTGVREAAIQACEAVDTALGQVVDA